MEKAVCLGKNYLAHVAEMQEGIPETPLLFLKPASSCLQATQFGQQLTAWYPGGVLHHECEIVLRISRRCFRISKTEAHQAFDAVAIGLDMTLRDEQTKAKKQGQPWEIAKSFPHSGLIGPWQKVLPDYLQRPFSLKIDGEIRQDGIGQHMRMGPIDAVVLASQHFVLLPGDVIFTGTPAGVGPVQNNSLAEVFWERQLQFTVRWQIDAAV